jgi:hypothetical protein
MLARTERGLLQFAVAVAGLVPVGVGAIGVVAGPRFYGLTGDLTAVSHGRYLSGLLLGIGLAFWASIPKIETRDAHFAPLAGIVFLGGCARLLGAIAGGDLLSARIVFALTMEMIVTPGIWFWRRHVGNVSQQDASFHASPRRGSDVLWGWLPHCMG